MTDLSDPRQFKDAYERLAPVALAAARRVLHDTAAAEDVVQDVFMRLWLRPAAYDPARGSLASYVSMLAHSRAIDRWRTRTAGDAAVERSAQEVGAGRAAAESAAERVMRREQSLRLMGALEALPPDQREAVLLAYGRGLSAREIAQAVKVPLGTAKSRVRLGLGRARRELAAA